MKNLYLKPITDIEEGCFQTEILAGSPNGVTATREEISAFNRGLPDTFGAYAELPTFKSGGFSWDEDEEE